MKFAISLGVLNPTAWVTVTEEADRLNTQLEALLEELDPDYA